MEVECQCGAVSFRTPTAKPLGLYHCHCLECRAQSASAFGTSTIFPAAGIFPLGPGLEAKLAVYVRPPERADSGRALHCYFCRGCGVRVMHRTIELDGSPRNTVSVKAGLVKDLDWSPAVHIFTDRAVVPIPAGAKAYPREPPRV